MGWSGIAVRLARAAVAGTLASLAVIASVQASTPPASSPGGSPDQAATKDIVDTAAGAGSFNTLVQAVQAAGLVETLKGPGPFTVFAPTDAAFAKLPQGTLQSLLANPAQLREVLTYHVVSGRVPASEVVSMTSARTVQGGNISIAVSGSTVRLNGNSTVTQTDIQASNGVIHVIDTVLLPPGMATTPAAPKSGTGGFLGGDSTNDGAWLAVVLAVAALGGAGAVQLARSRNR